MSEEPMSGRLTGRFVTSNLAMTLRQPCNAPAPLVVNGSPFVGCNREADHEGQHTVTISWPS